MIRRQRTTLQLSRETVRNLTGDLLTAVAGGQPWTDTLKIGCTSLDTECTSGCPTQQPYACSVATCGPPSTCTGTHG